MMDAIFEDLATFAHLEVTSGDLEPWAVLLRAVGARLGFPEEHRLWLVKLYNAYDALDSAWAVYRRWPTPAAWAAAWDASDAGDYACTQERRGLRGGKVVKHLGAYVAALGGQSQGVWLRQAPMDFLSLMAWTRQVWGVGRQTAFEWVEFLAKVADFPVAAPDAQLWESEGPRRSLQALFHDATPSPARLERYARQTRGWLARQGVPLAWEDLETVICDFQVMRLGRYYPGRHLAAVRGEIEGMAPADRAVWLAAFRDSILAPWRDIAPGIDKRLLPVYRDTGVIVTPERWLTREVA
jgi:hypothetical protein